MAFGVPLCALGNEGKELCVKSQLVPDLALENVAPSESESELKPALELAVMHRSNREVDKAGDFLRGNPPPLSDETSQMMLVVSDWRSEYDHALGRVMNTIRRYTNSKGWSDAIISGRTKRIRSIIAKLERQPTMALTTMQDIGGCRAVMDALKPPNP